MIANTGFSVIRSEIELGKYEYRLMNIQENMEIIYHLSGRCLSSDLKLFERRKLNLENS